MREDCRNEFGAMKELVETATLSVETKRILTNCLDQLPPLYDQLCATYDVRFSDKIVRMEKVMLQELGKKLKENIDNQQVAAAITDRIRALHQRHGLQSLDPKSALSRKTS
ncbi:MAG: hypothetical protein ACK4RK_20045 [Gemmataceae bacterium]